MLPLIVSSKVLVKLRHLLKNSLSSMRLCKVVNNFAFYSLLVVFFFRLE